jgi:hypothetical protein
MKARTYRHRRPSHGIIMSGDNPTRIIKGLKTQTRRLPAVNNCLVNGANWSAKHFATLDFASPNVFLDKGPSPAGNAGPYLHVPVKGDEDGVMHRVYPKWQPGDDFWVRETFSDPFHLDIERKNFTGFYRATDPDRKVKWRPSIHMPRLAARITGKFHRVWIERLQDISEEDAKAEGVETIAYLKDNPFIGGAHNARFSGERSTHRVEFRRLWDSLHGEGSWDANPFVIAAELKI